MPASTSETPDSGTERPDLLCLACCLLGRGQRQGAVASHWYCVGDTPIQRWNAREKAFSEA